MGRQLCSLFLLPSRGTHRFGCNNFLDRLTFDASHCVVPGAALFC